MFTQAGAVDCPLPAGWDMAKSPRSEFAEFQIIVLGSIEPLNLGRKELLASLTLASGRTAMAPPWFYCWLV